MQQVQYTYINTARVAQSVEIIKMNTFNQKATDLPLEKAWIQIFRIFKSTEATNFIKITYNYLNLYYYYYLFNVQYFCTYAGKTFSP